MNTNWPPRKPGLPSGTAYGSLLGNPAAATTGISPAGRGVHHRLNTRPVQTRRSSFQTDLTDVEALRYVESSISKFADIVRLRPDATAEAWGGHILEQLVLHLGGLQAVLYVCQQNQGAEPTLKVSACYAFAKEALPNNIAWGEGLVGQAAKSERSFYFANDRQLELRAGTGLGQITPSVLLVQPLVSNDKVEGVLELTSLSPLNAAQREFVLRLSSAIAGNLHVLHNQDEMRRLYALATEKERQLSEINANLDQIVHERTEELQAAMEHLKATQSQLVQSEKMASLGQLIAGVAHEINTPIGAVKASAGNMQDLLPIVFSNLPLFLARLDPAQTALFQDLLQRVHGTQNRHSLSSREERQIRKQLSKQLDENGIADSDDVARKFVEAGLYEGLETYYPLLQGEMADEVSNLVYCLGQLKVNLDNISVAAEKTKRTVFALKTYVHKERDDKPQPVNLKDNLEVILTLYHNQMKYGVELTTRLEDDLIIMANPDEIGQVWTNIIHNALQALQNVGAMEVVAGRRGNRAYVAITDFGPGIPDEVKARIFEPFYTTKSKGEGTGLGLSICKEILAKYEGDIAVDSEPGRTTFTVTFPLAQ